MSKRAKKSSAARVEHADGHHGEQEKQQPKKSKDNATPATLSFGRVDFAQQTFRLGDVYRKVRPLRRRLKHRRRF
jgi:hypothetical protein